MKPVWSILVLALLVPAPVLAQADHETGEFVLTAPKGATYTLIVPDSYNRKKGATVLFWLHGAGGSHTNSAQSLKLVLGGRLQSQNPVHQVLQLQPINQETGFHRR